MPTYINPTFPYRCPPELADGRSRRHPVVVVGAGPVGLTAAIDLALNEVPVVLLDEDDTVSQGSRAICWSKNTLEIWDRLGVAEPIMARGVTWGTGKLFVGDRLVYQFDLQPEAERRFPAFINIQQYYVEQFLVERAQQLPLIDLRWKNRVTGIQPGVDGVTLTVETADGCYTLETDYVIAADGVRSTIRGLMGLDFDGQVFRDRFLIADVHMKADFPAERWFWFDPPFHRGHSVLLHRQADDVWRIDFQLGPDADPELERQPERVMPRLRAMLGDRPFEFEWLSVYSFTCRAMRKFNHGRVLFVGDAAHVVSPFGARGGNSGVQDADNLVWKLVRVLRREAPSTLLDSYSAERVPAAQDNIRHSTRSTDFITPKNEASRALRDAVLSLAGEFPFARALVNSGRLSQPSHYPDSPLGTPDEDGDWQAGSAPGVPASDVPVIADRQPGWLFDRLNGRFTLLVFENSAVASSVARANNAIAPLLVVRDPQAAARVLPTVVDTTGKLSAGYDAGFGTAYLIRPDRHIAARWRRPTVEKVVAAYQRAAGRG